MSRGHSHRLLAFLAIDLRLIHNLACKVRLVRVVAPCSADRMLARQVSQVHRAGASAAWHYTLDMSSLRASLFAAVRRQPEATAPIAIPYKRRLGDSRKGIDGVCIGTVLGPFTRAYGAGAGPVFVEFEPSNFLRLYETAHSLS
jgi:hypothetical protein